MPITVSEIAVYPIKSLGGVSLQSAEIEPRGLQYDRRWMLVDPNGKFVSQREYPSLSLASVSFDSDGLVVKAPGKEPLLVPYYLRSSRTVQVTVWSDVCVGHPVDSAADSWFSDYLDAPVRLVVMPGNSQRLSKRAIRDNSYVSFADAYPIMLVGQSSLDDLNARLAMPILMNRFRPNIVTIGSDPFAEDQWHEIVIGSEAVRGVSDTSRCVMTTIEQETAARGTEPLKTLATYRLVDQKILFGRNLIPETTGWIHVGDEVQVR